jgi:hypothetical protein
VGRRLPPHGHSLSVVSALAQSDVDSRFEAVGQARMPRELATARMSRIITALPGPAASNRPRQSIAEELLALLPRKVNFETSRPSPTPAEMFANVRFFGFVLGAMEISLRFCLHAAPRPAQRVSHPATVEKVSGSPSACDPDHRPRGRGCLARVSSRARTMAFVEELPAREQARAGSSSRVFVNHRGRGDLGLAGLVNIQARWVRRGEELLRALDFSG